jgi:hypothetical protein
MPLANQHRIVILCGLLLSGQPRLRFSVTSCTSVWMPLRQNPLQETSVTRSSAMIVRKFYNGFTVQGPSSEIRSTTKPAPIPRFRPFFCQSGHVCIMLPCIKITSCQASGGNVSSCTRSRFFTYHENSLQLSFPCLSTLFFHCHSFAPYSSVPFSTLILQLACDGATTFHYDVYIYNQSSRAISG